MPVIKNNSAAPLLKEAVVLDLGDLARQGERVVAAARERARRIVAEAEQRAQALANAAHDQASAQGREAGLTQGLEEGRQQGRQEAFEHMQQQLQALSDAWRELAMQWQAMRDELAHESREAVVDFALRFAERVVHRVIEVDPTVIVDQVAGALEHVLQPLEATVLIHPDDQPVLEEALPQLLEEFSHLKDVHLKTSTDIGRGGCEVRFSQGAVEATVEGQMARIVDLILPSGGESEASGFMAESPDAGLSNQAQADAEADGKVDAKADAKAGPGRDASTDARAGDRGPTDASGEDRG